MRIAVCDSSPERASSLEAWIGQYCQLYGFPLSLERFGGLAELEASDAIKPGSPPRPMKAA